MSLRCMSRSPVLSRSVHVTGHQARPQSKKQALRALVYRTRRVAGVMSTSHYAGGLRWVVQAASQWLAINSQTQRSEHYAYASRVFNHYGVATEEMGCRYRQAERHWRESQCRSKHQVQGTGQSNARQPRCRVQETGGNARGQRVGG